MYFIMHAVRYKNVCKFTHYLRVFLTAAVNREVDRLKIHGMVSVLSVSDNVSGNELTPRLSGTKSLTMPNAKEHEP